MPSSLVTLAEYKAYVGITSTNQDTAISNIVPKVSDFVKNYCRRTFIDYVTVPKVEIASGGYGSSLFMSEYPLIAVASFQASVDYGQTYTTLVEFTDYVVDKETGTLLSLNEYGFLKYINGYKITYTAGYQELPGDLKLAVLDLVTYYLKSDMTIHSTKSPGSNSTQIEYITTTALPSHIKRVLDLHMGSYD